MILWGVGSYKVKYEKGRKAKRSTGLCGASRVPAASFHVCFFEKRGRCAVQSVVEWGGCRLLFEVFGRGSELLYVDLMG